MRWFLLPVSIVDGPILSFAFNPRDAFVFFSAVNDSLKTARLLREEWAGIGTLKMRFSVAAPDATASCPNISKARDMAENLLYAVGCDLDQVGVLEYFDFLERLWAWLP